MRSATALDLLGWSSGAHCRRDLDQRFPAEIPRINGDNAHENAFSVASLEASGSIGGKQPLDREGADLECRPNIGDADNDQQ
jgi:hypothetical protein